MPWLICFLGNIDLLYCTAICSEPLLVAHNTLLEISCHGSFVSLEILIYCTARPSVLSLCWSHITHCWKSHAIAQLCFLRNTDLLYCTVICEVRWWLKKSGPPPPHPLAKLSGSAHDKYDKCRQYVVIIPSLNNSKIVSEYDQEIPQSQTADNPVAPRGRAARTLKPVN